MNWHTFANRILLITFTPLLFLYGLLEAVVFGDGLLFIKEFPELWLFFWEDAAE